MISRTEHACRSCAGTGLAPILSFGRTPLADRLLVEADLALPDVTAPRPKSAMVVARRTDAVIAQEFFPDVRVAARLTLLPDVSRDFEALGARGPRLFLFPEPSHQRKMGAGGMQ
jgi:hypothetical protein